MLSSPARNFFKAFSTSMFEEPNPVAGVLKFVNVGPHLRLPTLIVTGGFSAGGATGMQTDWAGQLRNLGGQLDENAANFLNLFVFVEHVLVAQQVAKVKIAGLGLGLSAGMKRTIFSSQLLGRVASHPKRLFVMHSNLPVLLR